MSQCFSYPAAMTADELLSVFVYLIVTCDIPNWWEHYSVWQRSKWVIEVGQPFIRNTSNSNRLSVTPPTDNVQWILSYFVWPYMVQEFGVRICCRTQQFMINYPTISWCVMQSANILCQNAIHQSFLQLFCVIEWECDKSLSAITTV